MSTTNATSEKIARQEEGARIINMCFANTDISTSAYALDAGIRVAA